MKFPKQKSPIEVICQITWYYCIPKQFGLSWSLCNFLSLSYSLKMHLYYNLDIFLYFFVNSEIIQVVYIYTGSNRAFGVHSNYVQQGILIYIHFLSVFSLYLCPQLLEEIKKTNITVNTTNLYFNNGDPSLGYDLVYWNKSESNQGLTIKRIGEYWLGKNLSLPYELLMMNSRTVRGKYTYLFNFQNIICLLKHVFCRWLFSIAPKYVHQGRCHK